MLTKEAAYKEAFLKRVVDAVVSTAPKRYKALEQTNNSMITGSLFKSLKEKNVPGVAALGDATDWARRRVSDVDTGLGAVMAGKNWNTGKGMRSSLFTDYKDNMYQTGTDSFERFRTPSITAPIKTVATNYVIPFWAMSKAFEVKDQLMDKNTNQGQGVEYERTVN